MSYWENLIWTANLSEEIQIWNDFFLKKDQKTSLLSISNLFGGNIEMQMQKNKNVP